MHVRLWIFKLWFMEKSMSGLRLWASTWVNYVLRQGEPQAVESVPYNMFMREECMCIFSVCLHLSLCAQFWSTVFIHIHGLGCGSIVCRIP